MATKYVGKTCFFPWHDDEPPYCARIIRLNGRGDPYGIQNGVHRAFLIFDEKVGDPARRDHWVPVSELDRLDLEVEEVEVEVEVDEF